MSIYIGLERPVSVSCHLCHKRGDFFCPYLVQMATFGISSYFWSFQHAFFRFILNFSALFLEALQISSFLPFSLRQVVTNLIQPLWSINHFWLVLLFFLSLLLLSLLLLFPILFYPLLLYLLFFLNLLIFLLLLLLLTFIMVICIPLRLVVLMKALILDRFDLGGGLGLEKDEAVAVEAGVGALEEDGAASAGSLMPRTSSMYFLTCTDKKMWMGALTALSGHTHTHTHTHAHAHAHTYTHAHTPTLLSTWL